MGNRYTLALLILLVVLASCAAPPNVGKIEEKKTPATTANVSPPTTSQTKDSEKADTEISAEDDALEREIKEMLKESELTTDEEPEPKPSTTPKKTTTTSGKPGGLGTVKGTIQLGSSTRNTSIEPERAADGSIIIESKKGFLGENLYPKGTLSLKVLNTTSPSQSKPIDYRPPTRTGTGSPYEALLNATRQRDNQTRR